MKLVCSERGVGYTGGLGVELPLTSPFGIDIGMY